MDKKIILDKEVLNVTISRLCQQVIENHANLQNIVLIGIQPRGVFLAEQIHKRLVETSGTSIPLGKLDITFFRDDFRRRDSPIAANKTDIPFLVEGKTVILIDDVLFSGRSVRAALTAMNAYGRAEKVELMVLIDRKYTRHLPIEPNYTGQKINSVLTQKVVVEWAGIEGATENRVWLINRNK